MDIKDIKIGETYNVRVIVRKIENGKHVITETLDSDGFINTVCTTTFLEQELSAFSPLPPSEPPTLVGPAPKYDPCRRFRKGDEVEYLPKDGRELFEAKRLLAQRLTVVENEHEEYNRVAVKAQNGYVLSVPFYYLKLVTPVEDLEPYRVETCQYGYTVNKGELILATYNDETHPHAKEAAEAECARLNAEHRKEQ